MFQLLHDDREAGPDMVLVLGTSLKVGPVNMIPSLFPRIPRVLVNRELVGDFDAARDCCLLGDIDEQVQQLAQRAGWSDELQALIDNSNAP
jgi:NAD-dependent SIR2 family protein deacetylase